MTSLIPHNNNINNTTINPVITCNPTTGSSINGSNAIEDFPILCNVCLGPNPYIRMTRSPYSHTCKICDRAFTVYRWKPSGNNTRFKKTELCRTCAKLKNVCQTCVLDLNYSLPVQVRDSILDNNQVINLPQSDIAKSLAIEKYENQLVNNNTVNNNDSAALNINYQLSTQSNELLNKLSRRNQVEPYYKRNQQKLCSFYAAGTCNRPNNCPFIHQLPNNNNNNTTNNNRTTSNNSDNVNYDTSKQNIKDRYFGVNDPVANKMLNKRTNNNNETQEIIPPNPPNDTTITTLWIGYNGLNIAHLTESDLLSYFSPYAPITSINIINTKQCAFVSFPSRKNAELAAKNLYNKLFFKGIQQSAKLSWAKTNQNTANINNINNDANKSYSHNSTNNHTHHNNKNNSTNTFDPTALSIPPPPGIKHVTYHSMNGI